jgi:hypothetical protein
MSVVDANLKIFGIENLRIADGSIMPRVATGNIHGSLRHYRRTRRRNTESPLQVVNKTVSVRRKCQTTEERRLQ